MAIDRLYPVGLLTLVGLAIYLLYEAREHRREGRNGPAAASVVAAIACLIGAGLLTPRVLAMLREVGAGVW